MSNRYKIRMYESADGDGCLAAGRIVVPIERIFSVYADTAEEVERQIHKDVVAGKLFTRRVYQICPQVGNLELIRSAAIAEDRQAQRVFLDPAQGLYSEFRRLRYPRSEVGSGQAIEPETVGV